MSPKFTCITAACIATSGSEAYNVAFAMTVNATESFLRVACHVVGWRCSKRLVVSDVKTAARKFTFWSTMLETKRSSLSRHCCCTSCGCCGTEGTEGSTKAWRYSGTLDRRDNRQLIEGTKSLRKRNHLGKIRRQFRFQKFHGNAKRQTPHSLCFDRA